MAHVLHIAGCVLILGKLRAVWRRLDGSVRVRILIPTAVGFALTLGMMVVSATKLHARQLETSARERAELFARLVAEGLQGSLANRDLQEVSHLLSTIVEHRSDVLMAAVLDENGSILAYAQTSGMAARHDALQVGALAPLEHADQLRVLDRIEIPECYVCREPSTFEGWLDVRFSRAPIERGTAKLGETLLITAAPSLLLLLGIAWLLIGREVREPLDRLVAAMRRVQAGLTPVLADEGRPDELGAAARGFDAMCAALMQNRAELEAAYKDRLQRADRFATVGELASGLAHEIKNPLSGLSGALELLAEDLASSPRHGELVAEMQHQVTRLAHIMESMLDFARPRPARMDPADIHATLQKVLFLVGQQRRGPRALVKTDLAEDLPLVKADAAQLEQVFLNVCLNACQAMKDGGTLSLSTRRDGEAVKVEIADTGPGIPPAVRPHVFKPFYTTKADGNGLGLAICERIIVEHGGRIAFSCPPDGGTVFTVTLPIPKPQPKVPTLEVAA